MQSRSRVPGILAASAVAVVAAATMATGAVAAPAAAKSGDTGLGKKDRELVATAVAQGKPTVTLIVSTASGATSRVEAAIKGLGGTIGYREDSIGYLRAEVPPARPAPSPASPSGRSRRGRDHPARRPAPGRHGRRPTPQPAPGATPPPSTRTCRSGTPARPSSSRRTPPGRTRHTSASSTPASTSAPGVPEDDHRRAQDRRLGHRHPPDRRRRPHVDQHGGQCPARRFTVDGRTWTAPGTGAYRFGVFNERDTNLGGEVGNDVNRDGNPQGSSGLFGVLWDGDDHASGSTPTRTARSPTRPR